MSRKSESRTEFYERTKHEVAMRQRKDSVWMHAFREISRGAPSLSTGKLRVPLADEDRATIDGLKEAVAKQPGWVLSERVVDNGAYVIVTADSPESAQRKAEMRAKLTAVFDGTIAAVA